jgi:replicative superfamily II helicase
VVHADRRGCARTRRLGGVRRGAQCGAQRGAQRGAQISTLLCTPPQCARRAQFLAMLAVSSEFENMAVREDELPELDALARDCPHDARGGPENKHGKVNILLQAYVSRARMESFSLTADMMYVSQNAPRICRALFEICLRRSWSAVAELALTLCKARPRAACRRRLRPQAAGHAELAAACLRAQSWGLPGLCARAQRRFERLSASRAEQAGAPARARAHCAKECARRGVQAFERRLWPHQHALRQFEHALAPELLAKLEDRGLDLERLQARPGQG